MDKSKILSVFNTTSKSTLMETLDIEYIDVGEDYLTAKMPVTFKVHQPYGQLHGGATAALAESVGSAASNFFIDREKQILSFIQDKFNLPNLSLIGADFEDIKIVNSNECDFIYSCFGFQVEGEPNSYNNPGIRKNNIYEYNKKEFIGNY